MSNKIRDRRLFSYRFLNKNKFGRVRANSPYCAAKKLMNNNCPIYVKGNKYSQPWIYMEKSSSNEIKLWELDEDLGPSQWEMNF